MYVTQSDREPAGVAPDKRTLLFAVLAPFGAIALLATPLIFNTARQAFGI